MCHSRHVSRSTCAIQTIVSNKTKQDMEILYKLDMIEYRKNTKTAGYILGSSMIASG